MLKIRSHEDTKTVFDKVMRFIHNLINAFVFDIITLQLFVLRVLVALGEVFVNNSGYVFPRKYSKIFVETFRPIPCY